MPAKRKPSVSKRTVAKHHVSDNLHSEIVVGFVAAVGVDLDRAVKAAEIKLKALGYKVVRIRISRDVLPRLDGTLNRKFANEYERFSAMMNAGNKARKDHGKDIVALGVASSISKARSQIGNPSQKTAYTIHSLKHPDEVRKLRDLYPRGFYLIGVHSPPKSRKSYLVQKRNITPSDATKLMERDRKENKKFGQQLIDTYHLSDFFVGWQENDGEEGRNGQFLANNISRFIGIMFGHPNITPTFGEYAMFLAFSASLRSADLSRQVGAVITKHREVLGAGANDCPSPNGGLYWPRLDRDTLLFCDTKNGRDWTRGEDSNRKELLKLKKSVLHDASIAFAKVFRKSDYAKDSHRALKSELLKKLGDVLERSPIADLTEFGRVVHAEMEALLSCARKGVSTVGSTLFSTTFPCHNCAKHIVAAGVDKVVFIEPYLKSKAIDLHRDAIEIAYAAPLLPLAEGRPKKVQFEPFVGVGPRRFIDLFSMNIGVGYPLVRKVEDGRAIQWDEKQARPRIAMLSGSYIEREAEAAKKFGKIEVSQSAKIGADNV